MLIEHVNDSAPRALPQSIFADSALTVAPRLLGAHLFTRIDGVLTGGVIVETEAYCGTMDKASHSYGGRRTKRTEGMFGAPGHAYITLVYGLHWQFNAVAAGVDDPQAVLIRAIEPTVGVATMRARRSRTRLRDLASGPGKLCAALGITGALYGVPLFDVQHDVQHDAQPVWIASPTADAAPFEIATATRIGIAYAEEDADRPWRFCVAGSSFVSKRP